MRQFNEDNLTEAVVARLKKTKNPRLREIMQSAVKHLHAFARDVNLTEEEWFEGIKFLTAVGQKCDDKRQEFILLSDILGLSMMLVALNHKGAPGATEATVLGPFFAHGAKEYGYGADLRAGASQKGEDVPETFRVPLRVDFRLENGETTRLKVDVTEKEQGFYFPLASKPKFVRVDGEILKTLDFERSVDMLKAQLQEDEDVLGRVDAARALSKKNDRDAIAALGKAVREDAFWGVQAEAAKALGDLLPARPRRRTQGVRACPQRARNAVLPAPVCVRAVRGRAPRARLFRRGAHWRGLAAQDSQRRPRRVSSSRTLSRR